MLSVEGKRLNTCFSCNLVAQVVAALFARIQGSLIERSWIERSLIERSLLAISVFLRHQLKLGFMKLTNT